MIAVLLEGRRAVITGAASGVGRTSTLRFAEEGATVVCADVRLDPVKETVCLTEAAGDTALRRWVGRLPGELCRAPHGIRLNAICPAGMPYTEFTATGGKDTPADALPVDGGLVTR